MTAVMKKIEENIYQERFSVEEEFRAGLIPSSVQGSLSYAHWSKMIEDIAAKKCKEHIWSCAQPFLSLTKL